MAMKVYFIDDNKEDVTKYLELLKNKIPEDRKEEIDFEWLKGDGTETQKNKFYTEHVLEDIEAKRNELGHENKKMGILLDIILTEEEHKGLGKSFYPKVGLAKKIYFRYKDEMPIYIITLINTFGAQCDVIMGEDVSDRYISKSSLEREMEMGIKALFDFYINWDGHGDTANV